MRHGGPNSPPCVHFASENRNAQKGVAIGAAGAMIRGNAVVLAGALLAGFGWTGTASGGAPVPAGAAIAPPQPQPLMLAVPQPQSHFDFLVNMQQKRGFLPHESQLPHV